MGMKIMKFDQDKIKVLTADIDGTITKTFCCIEEGEIVGRLDVGDWEKQGGWISMVFVKEDHRNKGICGAMMRKAFATAESEHKSALGLSVRKDNMNARQRYMFLGFRPAYESGDSIVMTVHFPD